MSDPWDTAAGATLPPKVYFGQVFTLADYVYISKGEPKVLFDPEQHPADKRFTQIKIDGVCNRQDGTSYEISREMIAEFGREWAGIVLPSLKVCGIHPKELDEKWASWEMAKTGRKYTNDYGEQEATTFKFLAIYDSEEECRAAEAAHYSRAPSEDEDSGLPMPEVSKDDGNGNGGGPEKAVAAQFLPALWAQSGNDVSQFAALLAGNPLTSRFFDLNSPEVVELIAQGVTA